MVLAAAVAAMVATGVVVTELGVAEVTVLVRQRAVSKEANPGESWLVEAVAVVAVGAAMHYGLKLYEIDV